ncbi:hypothetical protein EVAR_42926_1 [Eumeta japonica]|uniref:Uncharacterized protein n=1 Tax=Eumeta variegata TaxID=151549 RepID=A0A4C1WTB1_EUMVA|nr:hypothetical protein EVAR_42926_1 [Eumeta japonica]
MVKASQHVKRILQLLKSHRDNPERVTDEIIKEATVVAEKVGLEEDITSMPRIVGKQRHRSNHPLESPSEFWKRSLIIPYLDSVITSLETRFAEENTPSFALSKLHPHKCKRCHSKISQELVKLSLCFIIYQTQKLKSSFGSNSGIINQTQQIKPLLIS